MIGLRKLVLALISIVVFGGFLFGQSAPVFPLKSSSNNRYLVDQDNRPFLIEGDSPWDIMVNVDVSDATTYIADRAAHGMNTLLVDVIADSGVNGPASGCTLDSICPFNGTISGSCSPASSCYDLTQPNSSYFARLSTLISTAATYNITVMLVIFDMDSYLATYRANGDQAVYGFGQYLGTTFKSTPNIIWLMGNDFQTWETGLPNGTTSSSQASADNALAQEIMSGVLSEDTTHLMTSELNYNISGSLDDSLLVPYTSLAGAYTYYPTYGETLAEYNSSVATVPVFMVEGYYDGGVYGNLNPTTATNADLRRQEYWTVLGGGLAGYLGGTQYFDFHSGWQTGIDDTAATQEQYFGQFFDSFPWYNLVPDQTHVVVTGGYGTATGVNEGNGFGTGNIQTDNYVTAASTVSGSLVLAYCPQSSTITVDLAKLSGTATAQWYDPTNNTYQTISGSPFANAGTHNFTTPGNNSAGDPDWVLLMQVSAPPAPPTHLTATVE